MNRLLRNGGTWFKRNGLKGLGIAWLWDFLNNILPDTLNLNTSFVEFNYTPDGEVPDGAYNDDLNLDAAIVSFTYTL